jgi:multidrug efflux system membrane fusion protein
MKLSTKSELATFLVGLALFAGAGLFAWWTLNGGTGASAQQPNAARQERAVAVAVARAETKRMPFRVESLGTVQPMVSVAVRSRVDSQVEKVHFADGASVKEGDLLYTLDARSIEAQIRQAEATLARDKAQLEKSDRDVERIKGLVDKGAATPVQLADARTNNEVLKATVAQNEATLQNLRVLRTYYEVRAPASGRVGVSAARPGAVVRASDTAGPLAIVNQMAPIYVAFAVPERFVGDLRAAGDKATVTLTSQNAPPVGGGTVAFIENTVDPQTATILVRARFANQDERLWPGTLVNVQLTLRVDEGVVVPIEAVQSGQRGTFAFVVERNIARVRPLTVARTIDGQALIADGLKPGETVVTEGQLSLRDGSRVDIKRPPGA